MSESGCVCFERKIIIMGLYIYEGGLCIRVCMYEYVCVCVKRKGRRERERERRKLYEFGVRTEEH